MSAYLAEHILETLRHSFGVSIGVVGYQEVDDCALAVGVGPGGCETSVPRGNRGPAEAGQDEVWRIDATDAKGERWVASDPDYYRAACMLAGLMGCDLDD